MVKQISMKNSKNIIGTFKANIYDKMKKKLEDKLYMQYIMKAIEEAEHDIENGGKTYTLEEWQAKMRRDYEVDI